uniref:TNFR-Cys domain-containing protein n=1 Tax=Syphacia muris TaxID=451379 RepID=A0A0N5AYQ4_9BILA
MSVAHHVLNRTKLKNEQKNADLTVDTVSHVTSESISSSAVPQPFPSATLTNETFMNIDDSWPKDAGIHRKINFFGNIRRCRKWLQEHKKFSIIIIVCIVGVIVAAVVTGVVIVVTKRKKPDNSTITTTDATGFGNLFFASIRSYPLKNNFTGIRLRPDKRQKDGYIMTTTESVIFLKNCSSPKKNKQIWQKTEVRECETSELQIQYLFTSNSCSSCEIFDVEDQCRDNHLLCNHSTFIYCCNLCTSGESFCSVYGNRITGKQSQFLDASFQPQDNNRNQFKLSLSSSYLSSSACMLQTYLISITNKFNDLNIFPANLCPFDLSEYSCVINVATEQQQFENNKAADWTAALMSNGILRLRNSKVTYEIVNLFYKKNVTHIHMSSLNSTTFVAITSSGLLSMIKIGEESVAIVQPRCLNLRFPGNYAGGFLNGESLVVYNVDDKFIYVAEMEFQWS